MESHLKVDSKYLKLIELDAAEKVVCTIKKHPIGLVGVYLAGFTIFLAVLLGSLAFGAWFNGQTDLGLPSQTGSIVMLLGIIVSVIVLFFVYVAGFIYSNNILIITNEKIAQVLYKNLVDRKISQSSLGDLQDITVNQVGLLARIFKYGTIVIETAGEQNNYNFTFTPYPNECSKAIVGAREASVKQYGN